jgi:hypothetical protein
MTIYRLCGLSTLFLTLPCLVVGVPLGSKDLLIPGAFGLVQCLLIALIIRGETRRARRRASRREVETVTSVFGLSPDLVRHLDDLHHRGKTGDAA